MGHFRGATRAEWSNLRPAIDLKISARVETQQPVIVRRMKHNAARPRFRHYCARPSCLKERVESVSGCSHLWMRDRRKAPFAEDHCSIFGGGATSRKTARCSAPQ